MRRETGILMAMDGTYPIGTPGVAWGEAERVQWLAAQAVARSYEDEVLTSLEALDDSFEIFDYGALSIDPERYPLLAVQIQATKPDAPWVLITGGVHGYETSGVQGALAFLATTAAQYRDRFNMLVAPCVSPWGYETINRWNPNCVDPNRSFHADSPAEEAAALQTLLEETGLEFAMHMDLHETTDTDESEFRPALAARDGKEHEPIEIPDGFYTVGDTHNPQPEFQAAIIAAVESVTHIAEADENGQLIGDDATQHGVINYPVVELGLCGGVTQARFTSTTEVYPDSPTATPASCIDAQVAAVSAGLDFVANALESGEPT